VRGRTSNMAGFYELLAQCRRSQLGRSLALIT
jgi:hypothetical protein